MAILLHTLHLNIDDSRWSSTAGMWLLGICVKYEHIISGLENQGNITLRLKEDSDYLGHPSQSYHLESSNHCSSESKDEWNFIIISGAPEFWIIGISFFENKYKAESIPSAVLYESHWKPPPLPSSRGPFGVCRWIIQLCYIKITEPYKSVIISLRIPLLTNSQFMWGNRAHASRWSSDLLLYLDYYPKNMLKASQKFITQPQKQST